MKISFSVFCLFLVCSGFGATVSADTIFVSPNGSAEAGFASWGTAAHDISTALDVAKDGDQILVAAGSYSVSKTIVVNRAVTIRSHSSGQTTVLDGKQSPRNGWCFDVRSNRATIDGFTIKNFGGGIRFSHGEGTSSVVRNCVIVHNDGHGIFFNHGGCAKNCTVAYNKGAGLYAYDMGGGGDSPSNLILFGNKEPFVRQSANISLQSSFTGNPEFVSKTDFRLRKDSPCIDQGGNESWMRESTDAVGSPRIKNKTVDIGAFEYQSTPVSQQSVKSVAKSKWISLAPLVQPGTDLKNGVWNRGRNSALFSAGKPRAVVCFPLKIEGSYEFESTFQVVKAKEAISIALPVSSTRALVFEIRGDRGNTESTTATIRLLGAQKKIEPTRNPTIKVGKEYLLSARVIQDGKLLSTEFYLDDQLLFRWKGDLSQVGERQMLRPGTIQIETAYYTVVRLKNPGIKMLSGTASVASTGTSAKPTSGKPEKLKSDWTSDATYKAFKKYLAEVDEIDRVASQRKLEARKRFEQTLNPLKEYSRLSLRGKMYRGMLGSYFNHQGPIPFIMLSVPDGTNVWSQWARKCFNHAKYDSSKRLYKFVATGHVRIPKDGSYRLIVSRAAGIKLNGIEYALGAEKAGEPPFADVELDQGIYDITFDVGNNGGQLQAAMVRIVDNKTKKALPIFIYESELETFRHDLSLGVPKIETSRWSRAKYESRQSEQ